MWLFSLFIILIVLQRVTELVIAKKNENWMKREGAIEFGQSHYPLIVMIHTLFFFSIILEVIIFEKRLITIWPVVLTFFLVTQAVRLWALLSLGKYWNTKILVLPNANIVRRGPYRFLKHPNYVIVSIEFILIPIMFEAYLTLILFSLLNLLILSIRIPAEEKALKELTEYEKNFSNSNRFLPNFMKKM